MPVITAAGTMGSGIRDIARAAAARLGIDYVDQEILVEAARRLAVPYRDVESHDERTRGLRERLADMFRNFLERSAAMGVGDPLMGSSGLEMVLARTYGEAAEPPPNAPPLDDNRYIETLTGVIRELGNRRGIVILGRGSQAILRDIPGALHVAATAPLEYRVNVIMQRDEIGHDEALHRVQEADRNRAAFHRKFFKVDVENSCLYDIVLRSDRMTMIDASAIIADAAEARERAG